MVEAVVMMVVVVVVAAFEGSGVVVVVSFTRYFECLECKAGEQGFFLLQP